MTKLNSIKNLRASTKKKIGILVGLAVLYIIMQLGCSFNFIGSQLKGLLIPICYNIMLAVSLNVTVGILGELSLGHAGFMCIGAFAGAFVVKYFNIVAEDMTAWLVLPLAFLSAAVLAGIGGLIVGVPVLRLKGDYLAIVTLAFGEIFYNLFSVTRVAYDEGALKVAIGGTEIEGLTVNAQHIIEGPQGIKGDIRLDGKYGFTIAFVLMFITVCIVLNFIHSRTGRAVKSIRDNRIAAESVGINITKYKLIALVLSASIAGVAGALYAFNSGMAEPTQANYGYIMSINILVFVVLGGIGSTMGSIIAAIILTILPEWLRFLSDYRMLIYALVLILMMLFNSNPVLNDFINRVKAVIVNFFKNLFSKKAAKEAKQ